MRLPPPRVSASSRLVGLWSRRSLKREHLGGEAVVRRPEPTSPQRALALSLPNDSNRSLRLSIEAGTTLGSRAARCRALRATRPPGPRRRPGVAAPRGSRSTRSTRDRLTPKPAHPKAGRSPAGGIDDPTALAVVRVEGHSLKAATAQHRQPRKARKAGIGLRPAAEHEDAASVGQQPQGPATGAETGARFELEAVLSADLRFHGSPVSHPSHEPREFPVFQAWQIDQNRLESVNSNMAAEEAAPSGDPPTAAAAGAGSLVTASAVHVLRPCRGFPPQPSCLLRRGRATGPYNPTSQPLTFPGTGSRSERSLIA